MRYRYRAQVSDQFSAAHRLHGDCGPCSRNHGHNWRVCAVVEAEELDERGMVIDFLVLQAALRRVLDRYEHQDLNELSPFDAQVNPSAENVARLIAEQLLELLAGKAARLVEVQLAETDEMAVTCRIIADETGT